MPVWKPLSRREFIAGLRKARFDGPFAGGSHEYMERDGLTIVVPNPHKGDIGVGFLHRLLKQAGISREEWEKL
jgi:predicted RNA binding protein YcfA (HicA-like mRNA interferase family)